VVDASSVEKIQKIKQQVQNAQRLVAEAKKLLQVN